MDLDFVINKLSSNEQLPGIKAHQEMSPMNRPLSYDEIDPSDYRESSVMFLVYEKRGVPHTVVIERNTYKGVHSGQIGLPGGKSEDVDDSLFETALRETNEEIGVEKEAINHLIDLSTVFIPVSRFIVNPFISVLEESDPLFVPDPREVQRIIEIPISDITDASNIRKTNIKTGNGLVLKDIPYFDIQDQIIWGATALIFNEVRCLLED